MHHMVTTLNLGSFDDPMQKTSYEPRQVVTELEELREFCSKVQGLKSCRKRK